MRDLCHPQADLNGDGRPEVIIATHDAKVQVPSLKMRCEALPICARELASLADAAALPAGRQQPSLLLVAVMHDALLHHLASAAVCQWS